MQVKGICVGSKFLIICVRSSSWIVRLVNACTQSWRNFEKRRIKHGLKVRIRLSRRRGPRKGRTQGIQFQLLNQFSHELLRCWHILEALFVRLLVASFTTPDLLAEKQQASSKNKHRPPFSAVRSNPLLFWRTMAVRESSWFWIVIRLLAISSRLPVRWEVWTVKEEGVRVKLWCDVSCLRGETDKNKNPGVQINLGWCELYEISLEPKISYKVKE